MPGFLAPLAPPAKDRPDDILKCFLRLLIYMINDGQWSRHVLEWRTRMGKRSMGRPTVRWIDDLKRGGWQRMDEDALQDEDGWRSLGEAKVQQFWLI